MSFHSQHTQFVLGPKQSRVGTEYTNLDEAFGMTSMQLFQPHDDLMGHSRFDDLQIIVGYVRSDGSLSAGGRMVGYSNSLSANIIMKQRLEKLNGETQFRIIRAVNRAKAAYRWGDPDRWHDAACFDPTPVLSAYVQEQLAAGTGPKQYVNRMGGPNAAREVFKAALRISKRNKAKTSADYSRYIVTAALEISDNKYEELLTEYNLREESN